MSAVTIVYQIAGFVLAPLMLGVINRTKAAFAGRNGAPLLQPYYDLWKLLQKGAVYSSTTTWLFRAGPVIGLAAVSTAMLLVPTGKSASLISFPGDLMAFAGLLGLMRFVTVVAALDTGSSFEGMGASREVMLSAIAEPALFLGLAVLAMVSDSLSLTGMLDTGFSSSWGGATGPALALVAAALFLVLLAENSRIPVDDPNTHLELTMVHEVMVLDHSGPDFAFILYAAALKLWLFATLLVGILLPVHTGNAVADGAVYVIGMAIVAVAVGVVESSVARLRMVQAPHLLVGAGILSGLGVALALVVR